LSLFSEQRRRLRWAQVGNQDPMCNFDEIFVS
jgi:hypothetical protein